MKIYLQNLNGVSLDKDLMEWEMMLEHVNAQQADICCFSEMNMDVTKANIKYALDEKTKKIDKYSASIHAGSKTMVTGEDYKRGGMTTIVRGN